MGREREREREREGKKKGGKSYWFWLVEASPEHWLPDTSILRGQVIPFPTTMSRHGEEVNTRCHGQKIKTHSQIIGIILIAETCRPC